MDVDAAALLPADEANHGFDSAPLGDLSPTLLDRYITAAQKISRLAVGRAPNTPNSETFRPQPDLTQEGHVEGLPLGTRGGMLIPYTFPQDGEYDVQVWLTRDRNEKVEGLREPHELEVLLDRKRMASFTVKPPAKVKRDEEVDAKLKARITVTAGPHDLGVTFVQNPASLLETKRQPYQAHFNLHRHPRVTPAVYQVSITGPYNAKGHGDTPSRRRIFISQPTGPADEEDCAKKILSALLRRAYRRPVTDAYLEKAMKFYRQGREGRGFRCGNRNGPERRAGESPVFVPRRAGSAGPRREGRLSGQRPRSRVTAVVLPVEQHSGRRASGPGRAQRASQAGGV